MWGGGGGGGVIEAFVHPQGRIMYIVYIAVLLQLSSIEIDLVKGGICLIFRRCDL